MGTVTLSNAEKTSRRALFVCFNPNAGRSHRQFLGGILRDLRAAGATIELARATTAEAARAEIAIAARSGCYDAIVAAGGDGTIRQAAAAIAATNTPLGVIPIGTGNVLAHEIALPRRSAAIVKTLLTGPTIPVECGLANGEPFLLMAGCGFDARVVSKLDQQTKQWIGKAAYLKPGLTALAAPLDLLDVVVDGRKYQAAWAVVANSRHFGGHFILAPRTHIREAGFQAILFQARSRIQLVKQLTALGLGRLESLAANPASGVQMIACSEVDISAPHPVPVQIDGDNFNATPLVVRRGGGKLSLIVPT